MARTIALTLALLLLSACDTVRSDRPLGEGAHALPAAAVDGTWLLVGKDLEPLHVRLLADGRIAVAAVEWKDGTFRIETLHLHLLRLGDALYLSGTSEDEPGEGYYFGRMQQASAHEWRLLPPDVLAFRAAVESGALQGRADAGEHTVSISVAAADLAAFLRRNPGEKLWNEGEAMVLRRLRRDAPAP